MSAQPAAKAFETTIRTRSADSIALWETLVNIDSGSRLHEGVAKVGGLMASQLEALGFEVEAVRPDQRFAEHRVARRLRSGGRDGKLLVIGHLDTVWQEPIAHEWPFGVVDGMATGPGAGDMKGNLVMALAALRSLDEAGVEGPSEIVFALIGDEELGSPSGRGVIEGLVRGGVDWAICLEAADGNGDVCTSRAGLAVYYVTVHGRSAHVTAPDGVSAVSEMARKIVEYERIGTGDGQVYCGVGIARGGVAKQVVPDRAEMVIDLRARSDELMASAATRLDEITRTAYVPGTTGEWDGGVTRPVFPRTAGVEALFRQAQQIALELGIPRYEQMHEDGGSDGSFAAALGVPTIDGMGPMCWDGCSRRERVDVDSMWSRAAVMAALMARVDATQLPQ